MEDYDYIVVALVLIFFKAAIIELNVCKKKLLAEVVSRLQVLFILRIPVVS